MKTKLKIIQTSETHTPFENLVNEFCNDKEIMSIQFDYNPAIKSRHIAYIIYKSK